MRAIVQRVGFTMMRDGFMVLGGNHRWHPVGAMLEQHGPHDLGQNYAGYLVLAPNGKTFVAEAETGAFVGPSLEAVRRDIASGDPEVMATQMTSARKLREEVQLIDAETFWRRLKCQVDQPIQEE